MNRPYRLYFVPHRRGGFHIRPHKINGENKTIRRRTEEIQNAVGAGALDSPLYINVFSGRRRRRPLPRYRETVHFFSAKRLCEHNTGGASPSPTEVCEGASVSAKPKDGANNVAAGASPRPTNVDQYSACSRKIERTRMRAITYLRSKCAMKRSEILNRP